MTYPDASYEHWTYGSGSVAGLLVVSYRNRDGNIQSYDNYDNRNRLLHSSSNDSVTPAVTFQYDDASRVMSLANSNSTITRTYNDAGEMLSDGQAITLARSR